MEFWVKRAAVNNEGVIAGYKNTSGNRYLFTSWMRNDVNTGIREFASYCKDHEGNQNGYSLNVTPDLNWHHIALTWDGRNLRSYVDGKREPDELTGAQQAWDALATPHELVFGGDASTFDQRYLNGDLCRLAIYDRPLTAAQVMQHFKAAKGEKYKPGHYESAVLALKPCHYWRFDEVYGRNVDAIGNWSLSVVNAIGINWQGAGPQSPDYAGMESDNQCMSFTRAHKGGLVNTNSVIVDAFTPTNSFSNGTVDKLSMSVWFKLSESASPNQRMIIAGWQKTSGNRYTVLVQRESNGKLNFYVTDKDGEDQIIVSAYDNITDSNWHNAVLTWDGNFMNTYLDGGDKKTYSNPNVSGAIRSSDAFYVGMDAIYENHFDGEIDELALFNYALSEKQVSDLYKAAVRGAIPLGTMLRIANKVKEDKPNTEIMPARGVCAHRGAMDTHPENTLSAFREAIRLGAHMIEFDIKLTKDNQIVLMHDDTVNRTTNGSGRVGDLTFDEIRSLDAGVKKGSEFAGEQVPTLRETLEIMPQNVWLNVHTYNNNQLAEMAAREIKRQGRMHQAFLAIGRSGATAARAAVPQILICNMQNQSYTTAYVNDTINHGDKFLQLLGRTAEPSDMTRLRDAAIGINCFIGGGRPNTAAELTSLFDAGVDFPLVDEVAAMISAAEAYGIAPLVPVYKEMLLAKKL